MISTIQELKDAITEKKGQYIFAPGSKFIFDEFLVIPEPTQDTNKLVFECNGAIFDFSNVDRGLEIKGNFAIRNGVFVSRNADNSRKMFDNTKEELEASEGYSRFGLKIRNGSLESCVVRIHDKLGVNIGYGPSTISNCDLYTTTIYYEAADGSITNCRIKGTNILLAGNGCSLMNNYMNNVDVHIHGNYPLIIGNFIEGCKIYTSSYGKGVISTSGIELINISDNFLSMTHVNFYTGDVGKLGFSLIFSNNKTFAATVNIENGYALASTNSNFFYIPSSPTSRINDSASVSITGTNGHGSMFNIKSNLNELVIDSNRDFSFINFNTGLKIKSITITNNSGAKSFSDSDLKPNGSITMNLNGDVKQLKYSNNKLMVTKAEECLLGLSKCNESIITGNTFYVTGSDKILSNPGINMLVFKDNIIYSAKPFPIGLEDSYCTGFYQCVGNIIINKETM